MRIRASSFILALALGFASVSVQAVPTVFGSNAYEFIQPGISWSAADTAASSSTFGGVSGHLATVTSQAENDFLVSLVSGLGIQGFQGAWLGGTAGLTVLNVSSFPRWLVGPEAGNALTYTNWTGVEPNDAGIIYLLVGNSGPGGGVTGSWYDDSGQQGVSDGSDPVIGYFVEYENPVIASVPEPSTLALLAAGLLGLFMRRKRVA